LQQSLSVELDSAESNIKESFNILDREFCIVIPAYNEESRIGPVLQDVSDFISRNRLPWHVIVSIDGNDGTEDIVREFSKRYSFVTALKSSGRSGKGGAISRTLPYISAEYVILMDADGAVSFSNIVANIKHIANSDILILSRYRMKNRIPVMRRVLSRGYNLLVRFVSGLDISDTQSGYVIAKASMFKLAYSRITFTNGFYYVSMYYNLKNMGAIIREVDVPYNHTEGSRFKPTMLVLGGFVSLVAFGVRHSRFYKYVPERMIRLYYRKFRWI
jgi:glycosyltransferase involved in cell wall biosynthesis